jgi:PhnB protein
MEFYRECLGGELKAQTVGESPAAEHMPPDAQDLILHARLSGDHFTVFGSDMTASGPPEKGNNISLALVCKNKEEIHELFSRLSAGGTVNTPLKEEFFGIFGDLTDKYGVNWMFQFSQEQ